MKNSRERILEFIKYNFKNDEFEQLNTVTKEMEPRLKYSVIDRYLVNVKSRKALKKFIRFANSFWDVEVFVFLGHLCIGYNNEDSGDEKDSVSLDGFTPVQPCDLNDQTDRVFVTPALPAEACSTDKAGVVVI